MAIKPKVSCVNSPPRKGKLLMVEGLVTELPIPNNNPIKANSETGNINVFPRLWKNSHAFDLNDFSCVM
jgi:hypothetical protein